MGHTPKEGAPGEREGAELGRGAESQPRREPKLGAGPQGVASPSGGAQMALIKQTANRAPGERKQRGGAETEPAGTAPRRRPAAALGSPQSRNRKTRVPAPKVESEKGNATEGELATKTGLF